MMSFKDLTTRAAEAEKTKKNRCDKKRLKSHANQYRASKSRTEAAKAQRLSAHLEVMRADDKRIISKAKTSLANAIVHRCSV